MNSPHSHACTHHGSVAPSGGRRFQLEPATHCQAGRLVARVTDAGDRPRTVRRQGRRPTEPAGPPRARAPADDWPVRVPMHCGQPDGASRGRSPAGPGQYSHRHLDGHRRRIQGTDRRCDHEPWFRVTGGRDVTRTLLSLGVNYRSQRVTISVLDSSPAAPAPRRRRPAPRRPGTT